MSKVGLKLYDLEIYKIAVEIGDKVWSIYEDMDYGAKKVYGDQYVRSADSVGANIAEGYGRFHYKDSVKFYYNARGSLYETIHWNEQLKKRGSLGDDKYKDINKLCIELTVKLNNFITTIKKKA